MTRKSPAFLTTFLPVVLGTLLLVMSVAFVSIPFSLGGHPGEPAILAATTAFHPT